MKEKKKKTEYIPYLEKIQTLVARGLFIGAQHPETAKKIAEMMINKEDITNTQFWTSILNSEPDLNDSSKCFACVRSMEIKIYTFDSTMARFLLRCGEIVKRQTLKFDKFPMMVDIVNTIDFPRSLNKASTRAMYWGLMRKATKSEKQQINAKGTGYWIMNRELLDVLGGKKIPLYMHYWEGNRFKVSDEMITIQEALNIFNDRVKRAANKRDSVKNHEAPVDYDPGEWYTFAGTVTNQQPLNI